MRIPDKPELFVLCRPIEQSQVRRKIDGTVLAFTSADLAADFASQVPEAGLIVREMTQAEFAKWDPNRRFDILR